MKRQLLATAVALSILSPVAYAQSESSAGAHHSGQTVKTAMDITTPAQFVPLAAVSNMFEIQSSEIALEKSQDEGVQQFAQKMIDDHTKASEDMMAALQESGADVQPPAALDERHQEMIRQLEGLSGAEFDQAYVQMQDRAHQEAVALFSSYAENGEDGPLKTFAEQTLPTLQNHKEQVMAIES